MTDGELEIRSFRVVFDLERRIHRVDRWRLPLPYGLPLRSVGYALVALTGVLAASRLPALGEVIGLLPPPVRLVVLPVGAAYALTRLTVDGRSAHVAAVARLRHLTRPRHLHAWRRAQAEGEVHRIADVVVAPDVRAPRLRAGVVRGPAAVVIRYPVEMKRGRRTLVIRQAGGDPLIDGTRVLFNAQRRVLVR